MCQITDVSTTSVTPSRFTVLFTKVCARVIGLGDGLDDGVCWVGHGVSCGWSATSTVGVCARRAASLLWVAPWPGVGSVADASIEASLDAVQRLGQGCAEMLESGARRSSGSSASRRGQWRLLRSWFTTCCYQRFIDGIDIAT